MGPGIQTVPSHWNGDPPQPYLVQAGILPDWGTGSLYNSNVPMQDDPHVFPEWRSASHTSRIETPGTVLGEVGEIVLGAGYVAGIG